MTWTNIQKQVGEDTFLLKEDTFFLLLETGDKIVLGYGSGWNNTSKNTGSWSNNTKNT